MFRQPSWRLRARTLRRTNWRTSGRLTEDSNIHFSRRNRTGIHSVDSSRQGNTRKCSSLISMGFGYIVWLKIRETRTVFTCAILHVQGMEQPLEFDKMHCESKISQNPEMHEKRNTFEESILFSWHFFNKFYMCRFARDNSLIYNWVDFCKNAIFQHSFNPHITFLTRFNATNL